MAYTTIDDPSAYFKVQLYTGNGSSRSITFDDTDTNMQPDLIWIKGRSETVNHVLFDSVRGAQKEINSDLNEAEETQAQMVTSFDSDGFGMGTSGGSNSNTITYVAWCWKESADAGFDIVSWSGTGSAKTESHSLSAVPHFMFSKNRADSTNWAVYHHKNTSAPETEIFYLNLTNATADDNAFWNDTAPTSSVFSVGADNGANGSSDAMITYLFSEKQGFSKFGSFSANNNADGPFIYTGFRPAWLGMKRTDSTENWYQNDNKRDPFNPVDGKLLLLNKSDAEISTSYPVDFLANGFKIRGANNITNASGGSYVYMAFAEAPFVNSNGVPGNAR